MVADRGILIASVSVGAGHVRSAEAVQHALLAADPTRRVEHVDVLELAPGWVRRFYREAFLRLAERSPTLARQVYLRTDGPAADDVRWGHVAERIAFRRFRRFLRSGDWQHCICTHFLPCQLAYPGIDATLHLILTDFALHRFNVQPMVDHFFVATERMAATLRARVPRAAAHVTGIPIGPRFGEAFDECAVRRTLALDPDAPVVLVVGGGWGLGLEEMARGALAAGVPGLRVLVVCGANRQAYDALVALTSDRLHVFGFVADMAPLLAAADLVVSKPGGVTSSEALALGRPLLLTRGIPGHEDRNAHELVGLGAARFADAGTLPHQIAGFFGDRLLRERWTHASRAAGRPDAAARIAAFFQPGDVARGRVPAFAAGDAAPRPPALRRR